ncbi:MAG: HAD hydrolase family protein [Rhizonema sp. PD37]|nr:HAD hydrolase family protein [Rhizonema sp. PD37]
MTFVKLFSNVLTILPTKNNILTMIMPFAVGKDKAAEALINQLGLSIYEVLVFGDDANDLSLFRLFPYCIAMDNALSELKSIAWGITASNDHSDSIAKILWDFGLGIL